MERKEDTEPGRLARSPGDHTIRHVFTLLLGGPSPVLYAKKNKTNKEK